MIYLDSSVVLAEILAEDRVPPLDMWAEPLAASRLLEYEIWTRLHARGLGPSHGDSARKLLGRVRLIELAPANVARVTEPFPLPVRTLDALHIATMEFLHSRGQPLQLATYGRRMAAAAAAIGIALYPL